MLEFLFSFKFALRLINRFAVVFAFLPPQMPAKTTADNEMIQSSNCIMFWQKARSLVPSSESFFQVLEPYISRQRELRLRRTGEYKTLGFVSRFCSARTLKHNCSLLFKRRRQKHPEKRVIKETAVRANRARIFIVNNRIRFCRWSSANKLKCWG
jgi:hypothetical protein